MHKKYKSIANIAIEYGVSIRYVRRICKKEHIRVIKSEYIEKQYLEKIKDRILDREEKRLRKEAEFQNYLESLNESFYF